MAVTGVFQADFASFYDAVQKAEVQLRSFDSGAAKVESTLSRMTDTFSGRRIIQEGQLMAEVFERAGGASRFTATELQRMGAVGGEATAKLKALGLEVPDNLNQMTTAAKNAQPPVQGLTTTYRQFDGVLQAMGVNIGPQVKGLEDIAAATGKSATSLGFLGTAGLALGAGFAGWGIGRMVAEFTGLDAIVEKGWRGLLQYGNVAAETAAAKQDVINRAIANGAKETIRYSEAVQFNIDQVKRNADASIDWTGKLAAAHKEVRNLSDAQILAIKDAQALGATTEQLTNKFGVSADALKVLAVQQRDAGKAAEEHRAKAEALDAAYAKLNSQIANERGMAQFEDAAAAIERQKSNVQQLNLMEATAHQAEMKRIDESAAAEAANEAARIAANQAEIDSLLAVKAEHAAGAQVAKQATDETVQGYQGVAAQITVTGDAIREWINLMRFTNQVNAINAENSLFTTQSQRDRIAALPFPSQPNLSPSAPIGGAGNNVNVVNNINVVDTEANLARRLGDSVMRTVRAGTQLT